MAEILLLFCWILYSLSIGVAYLEMEKYLKVNGIKPNWWHVLAVFTPVSIIIGVSWVVRKTPSQLIILKNKIINIPSEVF